MRRIEPKPKRMRAEPSRIKAAKELWEDGCSATHISKVVGVPTSSIYRWRRERKWQRRPVRTPQETNPLEIVDSTEGEGERNEGWGGRRLAAERKLATEEELRRLRMAMAGIERELLREDLEPADRYKMNESLRGQLLAERLLLDLPTDLKVTMRKELPADNDGRADVYNAAPPLRLLSGGEGS